MPTFGPGTVTLGDTPNNFECEVTGGSVTHSYEETESKTRLCDTAPRPAALSAGNDTLKLSLVNDLTASGMYAYLHAHDLETVPVTFTPNTAAGASWAGTVRLALPAEIGADEWGADLESEVEFTAAGRLTFTPAT